MSRQPLAVALVHYPIQDRRGDLVSTAVTNLDLHDIARSCRTYGVGRFYVVTPVAEQQRLVQRLLDHWRKGFGATYNPDRCEALALVEVVDSLEESRTRWQSECGQEAATILTGARCEGGLAAWQVRQMLELRPALLVLGTGGGLAPQLFEEGWPVLDPIVGCGDYNHLSVRAAAAIILDRLLSRAG